MLFSLRGQHNQGPGLLSGQAAFGCGGAGQGKGVDLLVAVVEDPTGDDRQVGRWVLGQEGMAVA